ncbi:hypothetical protein SAMN06265795_1178 [Noviherbaspirillum humi]|uniref:Aminoacyl-tRNA synthetase n=1 Tax=Noviherbaspirillum humi TaxID=1688639 RepID=A0A239KPT4_9BURK|nr:aminoacyl-tRNA synthetase [Noviherbaspirillum humi]SNT20387.1 hypothetical protein SAMN06265795_1178 [Noviherbaspirillum humi]
MRMSDDQYFRSCVAQERHLAQLLGHHNIEECYESAGTLWENSKALPKWTRDWQACGPLLSRYHLDIRFLQEPAGGQSDMVAIGPVTVHLSDHPNADAALRFGIVKAAIHCIEHARHRHHGDHPSMS